VPNFAEYWRKRIDSANARLESVRVLLTHPTAKGTLAERHISNLLDEFLPNRWEVNGGFIASANGETLTKQIDVLLFDALHEAPLFRDGEIVVIYPGAARCAIEVKSHFDADQSEKALTNSKSVATVDRSARRFIFAFNGPANAETLKQYFVVWMQENQYPSVAAAADVLPHRVFIQQSPFVIELGEAGGSTALICRRPEDAIVSFLLEEVISTLKLKGLEAYIPGARLIDEAPQWELTEV
jgi:hypothetical protein